MPMSSRPIKLIVAYDNDYGIGKDNAMPWHLPSDLAFFKKTTMACPIIMGRKTYETIGRPLPGRLNIVVSYQTDLKIEGVSVVNSLPQAIELANTQDAPSIFVIGGAQIFKQALELAQTVYATEIHANFDTDTHFPVLNPESWQEASREPHSENGLDFDFVRYEHY
ncbi:dihydrofolate reductase [Brackiella oedipodis]|uniref:dihydrofolate reductase n=1 Tax=Brackiella oedipodis TaxID=124225 RepID=UPI00048E1B9E|nr:dihydrofolate reductase [Brackiella oedipodis]